MFNIVCITIQTNVFITFNHLLLPRFLFHKSLNKQKNQTTHLPKVSSSTLSFSHLSIKFSIYLDLITDLFFFARTHRNSTIQSHILQLPNIVSFNSTSKQSHSLLQPIFTSILWTIHNCIKLHSRRHLKTHLNKAFIPYTNSVNRQIFLYRNLLINLLRVQHLYPATTKPTQYNT
jgi:hypothetical protein